MLSLKNIEFVVFDVETTGLSPQGGDRIIEIAALKIRDLKPVTKFYSLIDPERPVSPGAFAVNGISEEMLSGAPRAGDVLPHFAEYIRDAVVLGYNTKFDMGFLTHETSVREIPLPAAMTVIDVLKMARGLLPSLGRYPLWNVAQHLGIERKQEHRALSDVILTWEAFKRLMDLAVRRELDTLENLTRLYACQYSDHRKSGVRL